MTCEVILFPAKPLIHAPELPETTIRATLAGGRTNGKDWRQVEFHNNYGGDLTLRMNAHSGFHEVLVGNKLTNNTYDCKGMSIDDQVLRDLHDQIEVYFTRKAQLMLQGELNEMNLSG